jgi:MinD-like ATPase involved in chromosome partitioning or flagellar assembly
LGPWEHCNLEANLELEDYLVLDLATGLPREIAGFCRAFGFILLVTECFETRAF